MRLKRTTRDRVISILGLLIFVAVVILMLHIYEMSKDSSKIEGDNAGFKSELSISESDDISLKSHVNLKYPIRQNMGHCAPVYGKIMIFIAVEEKAYKRLYKTAISTVKCYVASTNYTLKIIDVFKDEKVVKNCNHTSIFFRKHCAVATYLHEADWVLVLDADTGVVNPNHCIEEYIDNRVNLIFYERFFNWEIMSGNYLAKNSDYTRDFLMRWANYEFMKNVPGWWQGFDNGALHGVVLESIYGKNSQEYRNCEAIWYQSKGYDTYIPFVVCVRIYLGAIRIWREKIRLLHRAHGMARDWYPTSHQWCDFDFMIHGWKANSIGEKNWQSPFMAIPDLQECGPHYGGWHWRPGKRNNVTEIRKSLERSEKFYAETIPKQYITIPFFSQPDIALCYPDCEVNPFIA